MEQYAQLCGFLALGLVLGAIPLIVPLFISPRYEGEETRQTYECGVDTFGTSWMRFNIAYYVFALIFVAFEVDVLYLFPVALVFQEFPWRGLIEIALFLAILSLAIVYAWRKGVFKWSV
ncbi:MAG: NADH-quinone oxidoreductase subunit A [Proteobacteria bacterium]|nr:NADH-quinone oxidoreductase subunit A [Pseudomonadota bacterium]